jgi:PAS domain S-box-containing protein
VLRTLVFKENTVPSRDGRWFSVRVLPYRTLENVIDGVVITFTDATAAKMLESNLREQANQLRQMTEALPNLVWGCRPDGACDYLSQRWVDYTGIPEAEQLGYGWLDQLHPHEREHVREAWKAAVKAGRQLDTEFRIRGKDGAYRWFKTRSVPIRDHEGTVVKWYCTCTDVDDLKKMVEEREQAAARLTSVLDGIDDAFVSLDEQLRITYFNAAAERMFDKKRDGVLHKSFFEAFPVAVGPLEEKFRKAMSERPRVSFRANLGPSSDGHAYGVRVFPHAGGVSLFCQPATSARAPSAGTGDGHR